MATSSSATAPSIVHLNFQDQDALYEAYVPLFAEGGLFVETAHAYRLGDELYLMVSLPGDLTRYPVRGTVGWITPASGSSGRRTGIGVRFPVDEKAQQLRHRIEGLLGPLLGSARSTHTI